MKLLSRSTSIAFALAMLAASALTPTTAAAQDQSTLRISANTELQVLDPIATPSVITRAFAYMIWDTLVAEDSQGNLNPQMLESWQISDDGMTYTFKLRPGLLWSDGAPVTAADCIASIKRWGARDGVGKQLIASTESIEASSDDTFVLKLSKPFGHVIRALGKTAALVPFMMPERVANTPPNEIITEIVGSGPFTFDRAKWNPGDRVVFEKNEKYVPRAEPADGLAGGKVAHFDRVEFVAIPDASTKVSALRSGEVDYIERVPSDYLPMMQADESVVLTKGGRGGHIQALLTLNHTQPPFDNKKIRQALQMATDQTEVAASMGYTAEYTYGKCLSIYMCDAPFSTDAGSERFAEPDLEGAKALLKEAGYNNEPVVVLHSTDSVLIDPISLVAIEQMKRLGLNVDVRSADWSTVAQMRTNREPIDKGGWNVVPIVWTGFDMTDPLVNPVLAYNCSNAYPGWWCDERQVPVRRAYIETSDPDEQKKLAGELQVLAHDNVNVVLLGQVSGPGAYRSDLKGVIDIGLPIAWNIERVKN